LIVVSAALSFNPASVHAISSSIRRGEIIENENKISTTPGQLRKEVKEDNISGKPGEAGILNKVKNFIKKNFKFGARIQGTILSKIGASNLSEKGNDGKTYQVNISATTKLIRGFGGKSSLSEFAVGNKIMVFGKFTDTTQTTIDANTIRNLSIQKRWGAFFGKVTAVNSDNFVMQTVERGIQTVYFGTAKFVNRKEVSIVYGDVKVNDRVRVKGVWDKTLNKINEVNQVKDFSLPAIAK
jgi:hypothetical protein